MDKKRKAPGFATLRKKPRRDKSEFVSVEVGMREFKKRLASSGESPAAAKTDVEDLTQNLTARSRTRAKTPAKKPAALNKKTPVKKSPTATATKKSVAVKKTPVKRATRQTKLTLAEVKMQLEKEQKERVEMRIQTLHRPVTPASTAAIAADQEASMATYSQNDKPVIEIATLTQSLSIKATEAVKAVPIAQPSAVAAPLEVSTSKNEFIADDLDEDLMFALALEEVERNLTTAQKPLLATEAAALASTSVQVSDSTAILSREKLETSILPAQVVEPIQSQLPEVQVEVEQEKPALVAPDVLEEMERLREENELLRRSNERLQAAVTSPTHAETPPNKLHEQHDTSNAKYDGAMSLRSSSSKSTTTSSTARYLDLGRGDSEHEMDQTAPASEGVQPQKLVTNGYSDENGNGYAEGQIEAIQTKQNTEDMEVEVHEEVEPSVGQKVSVKNDSKAATTKKETQLIGCSGSADDDHSLEPLAAQDTQDGQDRSAALERDIMLEKCPIKMDVIEPSTQTTTGSDEGNASDVSISEGEEEEEEENDNEMEKVNGEVEEVQDDCPAPRTSTIDSGNYTEYKAQQEYDIDSVEDDDMDDTRDNEAVLSERVSDLGKAVINESGSGQEPGTPVKNSDILERTTDSSNSDEDEDDEVIAVKHKGRRELILSSSSSSESESESEEEEAGDTLSTNVLEAALRAAGGDSSCKNQPKPSSSTIVSTKNMGASLQPVKVTSKKRKTPGFTVSAKTAPSVKSSLLWPALDEFYDFLLDVSPRKVSERKREHLQQYVGGKLPAKHASIEDYCALQLDAIMEEILASVHDSTNRRGGGRSGPTRQLSLASVSPCGVQASTSSLGLSFGAIFSESGFTGNTSSSNDYILTFDAPALGKKSSSDFISGDLVLVRSPRWKNYEMSVFGVILCDSVVAVGGKSNTGAKNGGESDQICVLVRAKTQDREDAVENFSVMTELCLSNQRVASWKWSLQQVHNTTTSAREFQAIKSISFLPTDLQLALRRGKLVPSSKAEHKSTKSSSILSPSLLKHLEKHYNESQMQAILGCLGENSRVIIQGPPGTGKTKTILGLLSALLDGAGLSTTLQKAKGTARIRVGASLQSAGSSAVSKTVAETSIRILVAAPSNAAVDELVLRVLSEGLFDGQKGESYRPRIVRVGRPESSQQQSGLAAAREASESKKTRNKMRKYAREVEEVLLESLVTKHRNNFPTIKQARQAIIKNAQIVFCTLSGAGSVAMCEFAQDFDALIIDEAAQAVEASTLIPFKFRPHRVVLVGDHRQLPATVISKKLVTMGYDRSLQQRLVENGSPVLLLTKQYRMHPEIAEFPSSYFYEGRLVQDTNMRDWTAQDYHRDAKFKPLLFLDVHGAQSQVSGSTSFRNLSEVEVVVQLIRRLLKKFPHNEWKKRIGVIAPYKQQIHEVRGALGRLESECDRLLGIEVNTVDGFQGREKEIIIYSCVRTNHGGRKKKQRRGSNESDVLDAFWADERRMNVAITRAKSSLWIVGNSTLLQQSRAWRALIQHTKDHGRYVADAASTLASKAKK